MCRSTNVFLAKPWESFFPLSISTNCFILLAVQYGHTIGGTMCGHKPTIVTLNNKCAMFIPFGSIIFGPEGLVRVHLILPDSHLVAITWEQSVIC